MGLYYTLSNGEEVEIRIRENEEYREELEILLFSGSTTLSYPLDKILSLNEVIADIENQYNDLKEADIRFFYKCNGFYD